MKGDTNRQGSIPTDDEELIDWWAGTQQLCNNDAFDYYKTAIAKGIAPEVARNILPVAAKTKLYMNGTLRSWIHYFDLRCDAHTQLEHRGLALCIRALFAKEFPIISEALWPEQ